MVKGLTPPQYFGIFTEGGIFQDVILQNAILSVLK
jgi:hypothetical protein